MSGPPLRAILYARVSTDGGSQDEERQLVDLRTKAGAEGWSIVEEVRDRWTGTRDDRPGLARIRELAASGGADLVAVTEASRLTRAGIESLLRIVRELQTSGVAVRSLTEPWLGSEGPTRDLLLALAGWASKFERDAIAARTTSKIRSLQEDHARTGRWSTKSGNPIGRPRRMTEDLERRILQLRAEGLPWKVIAMRTQTPAGTCRKVRPKLETPVVGNPPAGFGA